MSRILIEETKRIECGYMVAVTIVGVKYSIDGESKWLYHEKCEGGASFHASDEDIFDLLVDTANFDIQMEDDEDEDAYEKRKAEIEKKEENARIEVFDGIDLNYSYENLEKNLSDKKNPSVALLRYAIALGVCEESDFEDLTNYGVGKYSDDVYLPVASMFKRNQYGDIC